MAGVPAGAGLMRTVGARHGLGGAVASVSSIIASPVGEKGTALVVPAAALPQ